ncbi:VPLPA-CTERM sorting domain-containing protein [Roseobacter sp. A03A-229]
MKLLQIALFCALTALALPAKAATVTLGLHADVPTLGNQILTDGTTTSAGGFTLTFQSVVAQDATRGLALPIGTIFGEWHAFGIISVGLTFNTDTIIHSYDLGYSNATGDIFQISGVNGTSGRNDFGKTGVSTFDMGTIPVFLAGETYTLTHTIRGSRDVAMLRSLQVSSPPAVVPLPASLPLLLAGVGAVALLRRRRPAAKHGNPS